MRGCAVGQRSAVPKCSSLCLWQCLAPTSLQCRSVLHAHRCVLKLLAAKIDVVIFVGVHSVITLVIVQLLSNNCVTIPADNCSAVPSQPKSIPPAITPYRVSHCPEVFTCHTSACIVGRIEPWVTSLSLISLSDSPSSGSLGDITFVESQRGYWVRVASFHKLGAILGWSSNGRKEWHRFLNGIVSGGSIPEY